jgi:hypothetical protein
MKRTLPFMASLRYEEMGEILLKVALNTMNINLTTWLRSYVKLTGNITVLHQFY